MKNKFLVFCGISHLSINYGLVSAKLGNKVYFYDTHKKIDMFLKNKNTINEPKLDKYFKKYKKNINFISKLPNDLSQSIIFLALDIATTKNNVSDYKFINKNINFLVKNISNKNCPLVLMSQVRPHFTRKINWPLKFLYYQVETLIFGDAINRAENPERIIVGTHNGLVVNNIFYFNYLKLFKSNLLFMKYEEAELCKMFINSYLVSNVTLTNNLAEICKKLNLNWNKPKEALMLDKRIGKYAYLKPGLGISGGNLERDIVNLNQINNELKIESPLFKVFLSESSRKKKWLDNTVNNLIKKKLIIKKFKIGIIGITYKENTNSIKNSPSLILLKKLQKYKIYCYDKILYDSKISKYKINWLSLKKILSNTDIVFIMHLDSKINSIMKKNYLNKKYISTIIDPYSVISKVIQKKIINYVSL